MFYLKRETDTHMVINITREIPNLPVEYPTALHHPCSITGSSVLTLGSWWKSSWFQPEEHQIQSSNIKIFYCAQMKAFTHTHMSIIERKWTNSKGKLKDEQITFSHRKQGGFPGGLDSKDSARQYRFDPWVGKTPWRREWQLIPVFLPWEFHGQRRLVSYSPWGCKESDMTEWLTLSLSL